MPLTIVQRSVDRVPGGMPVTPVEGEAVFAIVAIPLTTVQVPVPVAGVFAARVKSPLLHLIWSGPALDTDGKACTVAAPVANVCAVALVLLALTFPLAPFVASDFKRIYTVVADTEAPLLAMIKDPA